MFEVNCTGKWLALQIGVHHTQVSRWRRGANTPTTAYQLAIANALASLGGTWTPAQLWPEVPA
jgi:DNA-binding transcriptional regulator YdaS (Cro superfamily)